MTLIQCLQALSGLAWLAVAWFFHGAILRVLRRKADGRGELDFFRAINFFIALTQAGFALRWWIFPSSIRAMPEVELAAWGLLYALSTIIAITLLVASYSYERARGWR